jgi:DNA-binding NarL/FixJ family response regulator
MSIVIVDDSAVVRDMLREMLAKVEGAEVVGEFESPAPAIESIRNNPPDVILLDMQLVNGSGLEVLRAVSAEHPSVKSHAFHELRGGTSTASDAWKPELMPSTTRRAT